MYSARQRRVPSALQIAILRCLLEGKTDGTAARELGIGVRTLRRHVGILCDHLAVEGRLALGAAATRAGWLEMPPLKAPPGIGLSTRDKYQIFASVLTGRVSAAEAASAWGLDREEVTRICQTAAQAAYNSLAA